MLAVSPSHSGGPGHRTPSLSLHEDDQPGLPVDHLVRLGELRRRRGAAVYKAVVKHIGYRYNHEYNTKSRNIGLQKNYKSSLAGLRFRKQLKNIGPRRHYCK
jgi:hypothetical protein